MKFNLKKFLKTLKLNESTISMVLGVIVIVITAALVVNYFKDNGIGKGSLLDKAGETVQTGFAKTHIVSAGESLWTIAESEIGSGYNWVDIAAENNINDPNVILEGQKLVIPSVEPKIIADSSVASAPITGATYEVVKGDNLWNIAVRAYGDGYKWVEIVRENNLSQPGIIHPGNILTLPR